MSEQPVSGPAGGPESFHYTNQGQCMHIGGTDDAADLDRTRNAFSLLGTSPLAWYTRMLGGPWPCPYFAGSTLLGTLLGSLHGGDTHAS